MSNFACHNAADDRRAHCEMCDGTKADCTPCPGIVCQECADAAEWHRAIMAETCGEDDAHCTCVPVLKKAIAEKDAEIAKLKKMIIDADAYNGRLEGLELSYGRLQAATRRVVDALRKTPPRALFGWSRELRDALADPTIVALRRE